MGGGERNITYLLSLIYVMAWNVATPFIPLYLTAHGASATEVGVVVSVSGLLPLLFAVHVGALTDVHGPVAVGKWSVAVEAVACVVLLAVPTAAGVAVAYGLLGLGNLGLTVATQLVVAELGPPTERATNYGYYSSWISAGMVLGPVAGGLLADLWGYRAVFAAVLLLGVPSFLLVGRLALRPRSASPPTVLWSAHRSVRSILGLPGVVLILFISFMVISGQSLRQSFYPLYLQGVGLSTTLIGVVIGVGSLTSMLIRPFIGRGVSYAGHATLLVCATGLATVSICVTPLVSSLGALLLASAGLGASIGVTQPLTMSLMVDAVRPDVWGLGMGLRQTVQRLATVASPVAFGVLVTRFGIGSAFYLGALAMAAAMIVILKLGDQLRIDPSEIVVPGPPRAAVAQPPEQHSTADGGGG